MAQTRIGRGRFSWPWDRSRTLAALGLFITAVVVVLYLGGYTRLFRGDEVPAGDVLVVRADAGVITSVVAKVELDQASGIPTFLTVLTNCSPGEEVVVRADGTRTAATESRGLCPSNGSLSHELQIGLTEVNAVAALDGGTGIFDLTIDPRDFENPPAKVSITTTLSWSAHFDEVYGDGRATNPREAQWEGSGPLRASGTWSDLILGRLALRLDNFLLLLIGAALGFFSSLLIRHTPMPPTAGLRPPVDGASQGQALPRPRRTAHRQAAQRQWLPVVAIAIASIIRFLASRRRSK